MAGSNKLKVPHSEVFPYDVYLTTEVEPMRDFDRSTVERFVQQLDKETGLPMWEAGAYNSDPDARKNARQISIKFAAEVQPVPPPVVPGTPFRPVEFENLTVTPYIDDKACKGPEKGDRHQCRARIAYSYRATGMRAPSKGQKPAVGSDGKSAA